MWYWEVRFSRKAVSIDEVSYDIIEMVNRKFFWHDERRSLQLMNKVKEGKV